MSTPFPWACLPKSRHEISNQVHHPTAPSSEGHLVWPVALAQTECGGEVAGEEWLLLDAGE
jgi:hypothetical protein